MAGIDDRSVFQMAEDRREDALDELVTAMDDGLSDVDAVIDAAGRVALAHARLMGIADRIEEELDESAVDDDDDEAEATAGQEHEGAD